MENTMKGGMILPSILFLFCIFLLVPMAFFLSDAISKISFESPRTTESLVSVMSLDDSQAEARR